MLTRDYELSVLSEGPGNVTQRQSEEKTSLVSTQQFPVWHIVFCEILNQRIAVLNYSNF